MPFTFIRNPQSKEEAQTTFRRLALRLHPDKQANRQQDFQTLCEERDAWKDYFKVQATNGLGSPGHRLRLHRDFFVFQATNLRLWLRVHGAIMSHRHPRTSGAQLNGRLYMVDVAVAFYDAWIKFNRRFPTQPICDAAGFHRDVLECLAGDHRLFEQTRIPLTAMHMLRLVNSQCRAQHRFPWALAVPNRYTAPTTNRLGVHEAVREWSQASLVEAKVAPEPDVPALDKKHQRQLTEQRSRIDELSRQCRDAKQRLEQQQAQVKQWQQQAQTLKTQIRDLQDQLRLQPPSLPRKRPRIDPPAHPVSWASSTPAFSTTNWDSESESGSETESDAEMNTRSPDLAFPWDADLLQQVDFLEEQHARLVSLFQAADTKDGQYTTKAFVEHLLNEERLDPLTQTAVRRDWSATPTLSSSAVFLALMHDRRLVQTRQRLALMLVHVTTATPALQFAMARYLKTKSSQVTVAAIGEHEQARCRKMIQEWRQRHAPCLRRVLAQRKPPVYGFCRHTTKLGEHCCSYHLKRK